LIVRDRVWRSTDGRFVEEGNPDAAFLAFAAGQEVADPEAERLGLTGYLKSLGKPQDKAAARPHDKGVHAPGRK
jgi:hypothetical protein